MRAHNDILTPLSLLLKQTNLTVYPSSWFQFGGF